MAELGNAYVNIVPKAPGIENEISSLLGGPTEAAGEKGGESFGSKLLGGLKKVMGAAAVGAVIKQAFEAGGALEQSFGGLETIYGDAADQAKEFAMAAAAAGISANDYAEQAVSFGASLKQAFEGDTTKAVEAANTALMDMADNAAKMGTPIESLQTAYQGFAKGQYQLLDNLKLGYGGTKEEMQRLLADAEAFSGVHYDIDNLGDVYAAIHVIQGELGLTGVAAAEAQTTLAGSFGAMKASWENVLAALTTGNGLDEALANLSTSFGAFASNVIGMLANLAPQLPDLVMGLVDVIIDNAPEFIGAGVELIVKLGVGLIQAIPALIGRLPQIFSSIKNAFAGVDWGSLGRNIVSGIIGGLWNMAGSLWNAIAGLAQSAWQSAKQALGIGSPSKVFAQEVGRWIPAGMAVGIETNLAPVTSAVNDMAGTAVSDMARAAPASVSDTGNGLDMDRLIQAISSRPVVIEGDTSRIFKVVRQENQTRSRATNYNILAGARA